MTLTFVIVGVNQWERYTLLLDYLRRIRWVEHA